MFIKSRLYQHELDSQIFLVSTLFPILKPNFRKKVVVPFYPLHNLVFSFLEIFESLYDIFEVFYCSSFSFCSIFVEGTFCRMNQVSSIYISSNFMLFNIH